MNEETKRQWDALNDLRKAAFERFNSRRTVEFQLLTMFWGALAALILLILKGEVKSWGNFHFFVVAVISVSSFFSFIRWTKGMNEANKLDRDTSLFFESEMMKLVQLSYSVGINTKLAENSSRAGVFSYWSHQLQLMVTALLVTTLISVAWLK